MAVQSVDVDGAGKETYFASPERAQGHELEGAIERVAGSSVMAQVLAALGGSVVVLNGHRQIVALNSGFLAGLGRVSPRDVLGLRPGEALGCRHVEAAPSGCGTARACADCGAALAIASAQGERETVERECLLTVRTDEGDKALELEARAAPLCLDGANFVLLALRDISDQKRRQSLERLFLHDLFHTVAALRGYSELLRGGMSASPDVLEEVGEIVQRIVEEIEAQRDLARAERGEITVRPSLVSTGAVLDDMARIFLRHDVSCERSLHCGGARVKIRTDAFLLARILVDMVKNAFEASPPGGRVSVRCVAERDAVEFLVHNVGIIEPRAIAQMFQRSFSTKSNSGRGLGTYSMKLFAERYLQGKVRFSSSPESGTVFALRIPRDLEGARAA